MAYVKNANNNNSLFEITYTILGIDCADSVLVDAHIATDDARQFIIDVPAGREAKTIVSIFKDVLGIDYQDYRLTIDEYWA